VTAVRETSTITTTRKPNRRRTPRRPVERTPDDTMLLAASAISSLSLTWLVFARLTDGIGWFGFLVFAYIVFIATYWAVLAEQHGRNVATDRIATAIIVSGAIALFIPLALLVGYVVVKGMQALRLTFFIHDMRGVRPSEPATAGGGSHAVVGTLEQVGLALLWSVPLGLLAAVFLNESRSKWRRPVRIFVDAMSGLPSVVAGLFIFAVLIVPYANSISLFSFNGLMASLALTMIMLPTITQTVAVVLRLVPDGLREASLALGSSRARTVWSVVLPTSRTGITTAVVLGIARIVGETAPLLFTAFGYDLMNANAASGAQESLPLFVYKNIRSQSANNVARGFAGALVLMLLVLGLFILARVIGRERKGKSKRPTGMDERIVAPAIAGMILPEVEAVE
jgi:phosphate transport system permease protein